MLTKSELCSLVQSAFLPLDCVAELQDYGNAFGFAVYLPDGTRVIYEVEKTATLQLETTLSSVIFSIRSKIENKGITLNHWSFPEIN